MASATARPAKPYHRQVHIGHGPQSRNVSQNYEVDVEKGIQQAADPGNAVELSVALKGRLSSTSAFPR